jgi:hypothetical protein
MRKRVVVQGRGEGGQAGPTMISGAGGRKFLSPTVHTTPGARGSPSGVAFA